ncbi:MAG: penicillin acylase family protein [Promethearchaeota archaeon]
MEDLINIAKNAFPPLSGSEKVEGIKENVEILWDKWGIPHIYAESTNDVYYALGYVHASHRLWQMEFFRRVATGKLSELVGKATLDRDKHYKIIGLHRIAQRCAQEMSSDPTSENFQAINSYVNGVNSYIKKATINPPIEFAVLNIELREWKLEDTLKIVSLIEWGLGNGSYPLEILREYLINHLGIEMANKIFPLYSGANSEGSLGSNSWAISPNKSVSNSVLLASDPHLTLTVPAIWMFVHLISSEMNVLGTSFPGIPGIPIGHNEDIAWGVTNASADTVDLFKLEINPDNENQYKFNEQWVDFEKLKEPIKVSGREDPIPFTVKNTKHGPVVEYIELTTKVYKIALPDQYALNWSSFKASLENSLEGFKIINQASNWKEFKEGCSRLTISPQNFIYGDREGNIGHQQAGKLPLRRYGNGATVTPGIDEKFMWSGLAPFEKMLSVYNPNNDFVYTANYNEDRAPNDVLISQDQIKPYRQIRIKRLLQSNEEFSIQDFKNFQLDLYTEEAVELLPTMLEQVKSELTTKAHQEILSLLENWDFYLTKNSIAGAFYKIWCQETFKLILIPLIGKELFDVYFEIFPFELKRLFNLYENEKEDLKKILFDAFKNTISFLTKKFSSDITKWQWGNLHKVILTHPFSQADEAAEILNIGPFKLGGDPNTLNNGYYSPSSNFEVVVGPSMRQIHDLSDWDKSIGVLPGGQSGLPFHKHYRDLMRLWVKGKYIPLLFSREKIVENLEGTFKLIPK